MLSRKGHPSGWPFLASARLCEASIRPRRSAFFCLVELPKFSLIDLPEERRCPPPRVVEAPAVTSGAARPVRLLGPSGPVRTGLVTAARMADGPPAARSRPAADNGSGARLGLVRAAPTRLLARTASAGLRRLRDGRRRSRRLAAIPVRAKIAPPHGIAPPPGIARPHGMGFRPGIVRLPESSAGAVREVGIVTAVRPSFRLQHRDEVGTRQRGVLRPPAGRVATRSVGGRRRVGTKSGCARSNLHCPMT